VRVRVRVRACAYKTSEAPGRRPKSAAAGGGGLQVSVEV